MLHVILLVCCCFPWEKVITAEVAVAEQTASHCSFISPTAGYYEWMRLAKNTEQTAPARTSAHMGSSPTGAVQRCSLLIQPQVTIRQGQNIGRKPQSLDDNLRITLISSKMTYCRVEGKGGVWQSDGAKDRGRQKEGVKGGG